MICIILTFDHLIIMCQERLAGVYQELGSENLEPVLFATLVEHPIIQDIVSSLHTYKATVSSLFHLIQINEMKEHLHSLTDITGTTPRGKFFDFFDFMFLSENFRLVTTRIGTVYGESWIRQWS